MKNSNDPIGNRTCNLPSCSAVPQPTLSSGKYNKDCKSVSYELLVHVSVILTNGQTNWLSGRERNLSSCSVLVWGFGHTQACHVCQSSSYLTLRMSEVRVRRGPCNFVKGTGLARDLERSSRGTEDHNMPTCIGTERARTHFMHFNSLRRKSQTRLQKSTHVYTSLHKSTQVYTSRSGSVSPEFRQRSTI